MDMHDPETGEILTPASAFGGERFASAKTAALDAAIVEAMIEFEPPAKTKTAKITGNANYSYAYAAIEDVIAACRKVLPQHGIWFQQTPVDGGRGLRLRTIVYHKSGEWLACDYPIYATRNDAQGFASGVTYARRYSLQLALGIAAEDDDDANVADGKPVEVASSGRTTQAAPACTQTYPQRQQTAPALSDDEQEAQKRYHELRDAIDASVTPDELDGWLRAPAWASMKERVMATRPKTGEQLIQQLFDRAQKRREMLAPVPEEAY